MLCAGLVRPCYAQQPQIDVDDHSEDTTYWYNNKASFEHLDSKLIPSNYLLDYGIQFSDFSNLDGQNYNDSNEVSFVKLEQINSSLLSAQIFDDRYKPYNPEDLYNKVYSNTEKNHLRISGLLYQYQMVDNSLIGYLDIHGNIITNKLDGHGQPLNPFMTKQVFAMALPLGQIQGRDFTIELPENLWQSNIGSSVVTRLKQMLTMDMVGKPII